MKQSLEKKAKIGLKEIVEEVKYVGLEHYLFDLMGRLIDGWDMHYHKKNHTSPDNLLLHSNLAKYL